VSAFSCEVLQVGSSVAELPIKANTHDRGCLKSRSSDHQQVLPAGPEATERLSGKLVRCLSAEGAVITSPEVTCESA
jgi:hypothetical protein